MFERFTDQARRVLVLAQEDARLLHHDFIGTEHLLLGLVRDEVGPTSVILQSFGVTRGRLADEIQRRVPSSGRASTGSPPFAPAAKKVLELSLRECLALGQHNIDTEHILLAILRHGDGVGVAALVDIGVNLHDLRARTLVELGADPKRASEELPPVLPRPIVPRCPCCRESLENRIGYQTMTVPSVDEPPGTPIEIAVVFCQSCGVVINPPLAASSPRTQPRADG